MEFIVDTNVPLNAAHTSGESRLEIICALACLQFIERVMNSNDMGIVLDANNEIFREYYKNIANGAQNSVAMQFLNWVQRNLTLREGGRVSQHSLRKASENCYQDFPNEDGRLSGFDPADKKFVALSIAHPDHPPIVQGSDSLWWGYRDILKQNGVHVAFLCEEYVKAKYEEKHT